MVKVATKKQLSSITSDSFVEWCEHLIDNEKYFDRSLFTQTQQIISKVYTRNEGAKDDSLGSSFDYDNLSKQAIEIGIILSELKVDSRTLAAAILYPFLNAAPSKTSLLESVAYKPVLQKAKGVMVMDGVRGLQVNQSVGTDAVQIENLRKMLMVMVDDVSVVLIKLAERLQVLRNAKSLSFEYQQQVAKEVKDVYAPLANRLGVGQIKWEMEDLAFRYLEEATYKNIAKQLAEKRVARESYVKKVLAKINSSLNLINVEADLSGRAKHIYSIWKKMQRKKVGFDEIYDVRAVRVLVPKIQDCYSVLGVVHGLWKHIPKEFDDYIATPKENGYRSLHTAVIGPDGNTLEIQIRTHEMHSESELGVAAHWKYKEGSEAKADGYEAKITWLRQLIEWQDEIVDSRQLAEEFESQVFDERVYVFTPQGKLIDLPEGSTALDFAYRVHTDVGHRCRGAKANGKIISLTQPLTTGQRVEILTTKNGGPSRDWLSEQRGYLKSTRARNKVQQWFKHQDKDKNIFAGKQLIDKELKKNGVAYSDFESLALHFNYKTKDELYAGVGAGDKGVHQVLNAIKTLSPIANPVTREQGVKRSSNLTDRSSSSDILVEGVGNLLTRMAGCCKPIPGDEISGFVTLNRGIMIHRSDCRYLLASQDKTPRKILKVSWTHHVNKHYLIDLVINAYDRKGLLSDITALLSNEKLSVTSLNTKVDHKQLEVSIDLQVEIENVSNVSKLINIIEQLKNIISVNRITR